MGEKNTLAEGTGSFVTNTPFRQQAIYPTVRSFTQKRNRPEVVPFRPSCSHYRRMANDFFLYFFVFVFILRAIYPCTTMEYTDSQGHKRTSGNDPMTGTFHQTWVTAFDTICSVKGVHRKFSHQNTKCAIL